LQAVFAAFAVEYIHFLVRKYNDIELVKMSATPEVLPALLIYQAADSLSLSLQPSI
jgi:hypothetical protein